MTPHSNNVTDEEFFAQEVARGFTTTDWHYLLDIHSVFASALKIVGFHTVFEIGSGLGAFLIGAAQVGIDATGMDCNTQARQFAISKGVEPIRYILDDIRTFRLTCFVDCIVCVEIFEHCSDLELDPICQQLAPHCRFLHFTSTPYPEERDKEWGHINLKTREQWIAFFAGYGLTFVRDDNSLMPWGMLFRGTL